MIQMASELVWQRFSQTVVSHHAETVHARCQLRRLCWVSRVFEPTVQCSGLIQPVAGDAQETLKTTSPDVFSQENIQYSFLVLCWLSCSAKKMTASCSRFSRSSNMFINACTSLKTYWLKQVFILHLQGLAKR